MQIFQYERDSVREYAEKWALSRNPKYYDFDGLGGDCTNFVSQCIFAGTNIMNYTPVLGWYYKSPYLRTASWTGVSYLNNFLTSNNGPGPFGRQTEIENLKAGDVVQLGGLNGEYYHSSVLVEIENGELYLAAHSFDVYGKPLSDYIYEDARFIHIEGYRF